MKKIEDYTKPILLSAWALVIFAALALLAWSAYHSLRALKGIL